MSKKLFLITLLIGGLLSLSCAVLAWTTPTADPPAGNLSAPINEGSTTQTKSGGLNISGNVGIGTQTPGNPLVVVGSNPTAEFSGSIPSLLLTSTQSSPVQQWKLAAAYNDPNSISLVDVTNGNAQRVIVDGSGNVGIGTTSPGYPLDVNGSVNATTYYGDGSHLTGISAGLWTDEGTYIYANNSTNTVITDSGNVGIGTTSPSQQLELTKNMEIPNTTHASQYGIIYKNGIPFIHNFNYGDNGTVTTNGHNVFIGENAGNFTMGSSAGSSSQSSSNIGIGAYVLSQNTTGYENTANGTYALDFNTTGYRNTAIGSGALYYNDEGYNNTAIGTYALYNNNGGYDNTAIGMAALDYNTSGYNNTANGFHSLFYNGTGYENTANGAYALYNNGSGYDNTANGAYTLYSNTTGNYNTANGYSALRSNTTGKYNTANGYLTLYFNTSGTYNTANGAWALHDNTTGGYNTAIGYETLSHNTTGNTNTAIGMAALDSNTYGSENTATGRGALATNTSGDYNTANGAYALYCNTRGIYNTAVGESTLLGNTTGNYNTAIGVQALRKNTTGSSNTANGTWALGFNTTGGYNTAIGDEALYFNTAGNYNTAIGRYALLNNTTGSYNIANGVEAGRYIADGTTGNATSTESIYLGANTKAKASGDTNEIIIGYDVTGMGSNSVVLGNDNITTTVLNGNVGIGTTSPGSKLTVAGTIESTSGGIKFPDGTVQTSAASAGPYIPTSVRLTTSSSTGDFGGYEGLNNFIQNNGCSGYNPCTYDDIARYLTHGGSAWPKQDESSYGGYGRVMGADANYASNEDCRGWTSDDNLYNAAYVTDGTTVSLKSPTCSQLLYFLCCK